MLRKRRPPAKSGESARFPQPNGTLSSAGSRASRVSSSRAVLQNDPPHARTQPRDAVFRCGDAFAAFFSFQGYRVPDYSLYGHEGVSALRLHLAAEDKNALVEELAAKHGEQLRRFLSARVRNIADVPDIVQEVFLRVLRVSNHETIRAPEAYIFTIARHVAQQHKLQTAAQEGAQDLDEMLEDLRTATQVDPALEVTAQQCIEGLDQVLSELAPKVRSTFLLYRRDGLSMDEISARLGISRPMAKKYLVKALVAFRKRLSETE